jgi:hypothetical protein
LTKRVEEDRGHKRKGIEKRKKKREEKRKQEAAYRSASFPRGRPAGACPSQRLPLELVNVPEDALD